MKRYRNLQELLFVRRGTDDFVAGLGNEKNDPRQTMWRLMGDVRYFHHSLDIFK